MRYSTVQRLNIFPSINQVIHQYDTASFVFATIGLCVLCFVHTYVPVCAKANPFVFYFVNINLSVYCILYMYAAYHKKVCEKWITVAATRWQGHPPNFQFGCAGLCEQRTPPIFYDSLEMHRVIRSF